jgi:DNA-binding beta-propeller fold protein YncE
VKRAALAPLALAVAAVLPGAAHGAACSPLNCAPSQFSLGNSMLGFRAALDGPVGVVDLRSGKTRWVLPAGIAGGNLLVHQAASTLVWYDATRGARLRTVSIPDGSRLVGVSQDGSSAVVSSETPDGARFLIVSEDARRAIDLAGKGWEFDALRGDNLFLIMDLPTGGYQVRLVHVGSGELDAQPLKDPHESGTIWGAPYSRLPSGDGRYLFTLYIGSNGGAMVHELDLQSATARCIDLPGTGDYLSATSWALTLAADGRTLWAASPGYGRVLSIDVLSRKVTSAFRLSLPLSNLGRGTRAALSPDGKRIAVADGQTVAVVDLSARKVMRRDADRAIALGYSPAGRLWKLI